MIKPGEYYRKLRQDDPEPQAKVIVVRAEDGKVFYRFPSGSAIYRLRQSEFLSKFSGPTDGMYGW